MKKIGLERIGLAGAGMMGIGIATNLVKHGYPLTVLEHPGNQPLEALRSAGVRQEISHARLALSVSRWSHRHYLASPKNSLSVPSCGRSVPLGGLLWVRKVQRRVAPAQYQRHQSHHGRRRDPQPPQSAVIGSGEQRDAHSESQDLSQGERDSGPSVAPPAPPRDRGQAHPEEGGLTCAP